MERLKAEYKIIIIIIAAIIGVAIVIYIMLNQSGKKVAEESKHKPQSTIIEPMKAIKDTHGEVAGEDDDGEEEKEAEKETNEYQYTTKKTNNHQANENNNTVDNSSSSSDDNSPPFSSEPKPSPIEEPDLIYSIPRAVE